MEGLSRIDITFYGRGGQGAVTAAQVLAEAAIHSGLFASAFPEYGAERRGAPVRAYVRIANQYLGIREPIEKPDISVVFDTRLVDLFNITKITKPNGTIVINSSEDYAKQMLSQFNGKVVYVDAYGISMKYLGKAIVNTPMLGALLRVVGMINIEVVKELIKGTFRGRVGQLNAEAIDEAYKLARVIP
ncbi:2-oxoacid:acceptor oxidoreductase family protein [Caldivirga sp. UBA161]|uniref:2-oxoacid:acceptor oxidoreductase family protein n=1 Tax=Caldivirga sp. UBA161 TaxID=1915569 RepID=UPI0025C355C5|nr:2-oxoacid:acceptor oxidoreductase family protein [Caldivirga sp. UBA161]